jgi:hypothetical protein
VSQDKFDAKTCLTIVGFGAGSTVVMLFGVCVIFPLELLWGVVLAVIGRGTEKLQLIFGNDDDDDIFDHFFNLILSLVALVAGIIFCVVYCFLSRILVAHADI